MMPTFAVGEGDAGLSYSGVIVRGERARVLAALTSMRFTGYLGPQEGDMVVVVSGNPLAKVASRRRRVDDVARDLAADLDAATVAVEVDRDKRLRVVGFDSDEALPPYDSKPPEHASAKQIVIDDFGNPVMSEGFALDSESIASALVVTFGAAATDDDADSIVSRTLADEPAQELAELLDDDLSEDTNESERLVGVLRRLGLPSWIVSSDSLPRPVPGGPDRSQITRLGGGRTGARGMMADALTRPARPRPKR